MEFVDAAEALQFGSPSSWYREDVNGICGPATEVLQFMSPTPWHREDLNGIFGTPR